MSRKLAFIIALALAVSSHASRSFILDEDFESGSEPTGWAHSGASINYGYTTSPAPLAGTKSLRVTTADAYALFNHGSDVTTEMWGHLLLNVDSLPTSGTFVTIVDSFDSTFGHHSLLIQVASDGSVTLTDDTSCVSGCNATTASGISAATTYHIWWRSKPGSGANGEHEIWVNTADDRAGTASGFHAITVAATFTTGVEYFIMAGNTGSGPVSYIADDVQWADSDEFTGGGFTQKANDTFTDTSTTALASHTPDSGSSPWVEYSPSTTCAWTVNAFNQIQAAGVSAPCLAFNPTTLQDVQAAEVNCQRAGAGGNYCGLLLRTTVGSHNAYEAQWDVNAGDLYIFQYTAGVRSNLDGGMCSVTTAGADMDTLRFEASSTTLRLLVNGVEKLSCTDSTYATGKSGMYAEAGTAYLMDTFVAYDAAGEVGGPPPLYPFGFINGALKGGGKKPVWRRR